MHYYKGLVLIVGLILALIISGCSPDEISPDAIDTPDAITPTSNAIEVTASAEPPPRMTAPKTTDVGDEAVTAEPEIEEEQSVLPTPTQNETQEQLLPTATPIHTIEEKATVPAIPPGLKETPEKTVFIPPDGFGGTPAAPGEYEEQLAKAVINDLSQRLEIPEIDIQVISQGQTELSFDAPCGTSSAAEESGALPGGLSIGTEIILGAGGVHYRYVIIGAIAHFCS